MAHWIALLICSFAFGACTVAAMVLPRHFSFLGGLAAIAGLLGALHALANISQAYSSSIAIGSAIGVIVVGTALGYLTTTSLIPHLARASTPPSLAIPEGAEDKTGVVLLTCSEPVLYDPRAVAYEQSLFCESGALDLPPAALPFVFLTQKSRYRAAGGVSPSGSSARSLAEKVAAMWSAESRPLIDLASCHDPGELAAAASRQAARGARAIAIVVLGPADSPFLERSLALLADACEPGPAIVVADPVWNDAALAECAAERILRHGEGVAPENLGVALVCPGAPEAWEQRYVAAADTENYFVQRVRMQLIDSGLQSDHVRVAWLDWRSPDVIETVRHLAAVDCKRIIVIPLTMPLPTLDTVLDLERMISFAHVPAEVQLVTLGAWGDHEALANAVFSTADSALQDALRRLSGSA